MERSKEIARDLVVKAKEKIEAFEGAEFLVGLADYVISRNK